MQTAGGPALTEDLTRAEAELAGAEEDWNLTADHLRALRYDVTHTEAGTQRSANPGGDQELAEAERVELRARDRYDAARSRMNQLLAEFQSIDDEGRGRTMPPSWYSSPEAGVRAAQRNASSSATTSG